MLTRGFQGQWGGLGEDVSVGSRGVLGGPRYDETTQEVREEGKLVLFPGNCCDRVPKLVKVLVVHLGLTLNDPVDCSLPSSSVMGFSRQEFWSGLPFPPSGDLPNPGIEPRSPALQVDSLPLGPPGKPKLVA